ADRHRRKHHLNLLWSILGAGGVVRISASHPGGTASRSAGTLTVRSDLFLLVCLAVAGIVFAAAFALGNDYYFFAGYVVLQYVVLATAWNILGGYCGYVNFGSAAFFAVGAYSAVAVHRFHPLPIPVLVLIGGAVSGVVGFGMGYLTLRLRGAFFAIATLALAVVLHTLVVNWDYVGGSRGAYIVRPEAVVLLGSYIRYLFLIMMLLAVGALTVARLIERSRLGYGFATIRDDELAAEASGVPTLKLKLVATISSAVNLLIVGCLLVGFVIVAPNGIVGLVHKYWQRKPDDFVGRRHVK